MPDVYEAQNVQGRWQIWDLDTKHFVMCGKAPMDSTHRLEFLIEHHARDYASMMSEARRRRQDLEKRAVFAGIEKDGGK